MIIKEEFFTMSDGVKLYTRIVLPEENKKFPIVFIRTPYEAARGGEPYPIENYKNDLFIKNGYAIVLQHVRGKGDSKGKCYPYVERQDGLQTLEIIRTLPFYNGEIYITGGSYLASVHWCYLSAKPHDIKGAALSKQSDRMYQRYYRNGCPITFCRADWWLKMVARRYPAYNFEKAKIRPYKDIIKRAVGEDIPECSGMLTNTTENDFWINTDRYNVLDDFEIPLLLSEGWYDGYIEGMFSMWERLPEKAKAKSAFIVGPWQHATALKETCGYHFENGNMPEDFEVEWFNSIREKRPYKYAELGKVHYHSIGGDFWATGEYPLSPCKTQKFLFSSDKTLKEDNTKSGEISFKYDPENPNTYYKHSGSYNDITKAEKEIPQNVIAFESDKFQKDTNFFGRIRLHLNVKTDCDDTAFYFRVYFVENGDAYNVADTITSLSYVNPNYHANETQIIDIEFPPTAFTVKKGWKIRIDVSSNDGLYVPHSNTRGNWAEVIDTKIATNTVICSEDSFVTLPLK